MKKCDYMFWTVINLEMFEKSYKCKSIVVLTFFCLLFSSQKSQFTYAKEIRNLLKFGSLKVFLQFHQCWLFIQMHLKWNEAFPNMNCFLVSIPYITHDCQTPNTILPKRKKKNIHADVTWNTQCGKNEKILAIFSWNRFTNTVWFAI